MNDTVTVIDIVAQVTDETASGARSAEGNVSKLERSMKNLQKQIMSMKGKSKLEVAATLKDMASKGIQNVASAGKKIAGKVWTVTLKAVDLVTAPFKKVLELVANPIAGAAAFAGVSLGLADTINTFKDFEQGMANVKAISGATGEEFDDLTNTAKQLGETTMFSAAQAAEAMENLAMAGWKSKDIVAGMPGLLNLAAAGSVDLATAADVTSSALSQFSLDAGEAERVADVLAATATNSKTDVAGLGESLKYAGTVAGQLGYSIEDTALAIGLMGNASIDGTMAGTALKTGLMRLAKQEDMTAEESNAMAEAARRLGISMKNSDGTMKPLKALLVDMRKGFAGITDETERTALATALFGQNASAGMLALMDTTEEGEKKFNALAEAIENSKGAAEEMSKTKMDTLQGSLYYLQSAAEGVKIAIGEKLQPYVKGLVDWTTAHMPDIQSAVGSAVDFILGKIDDVTASIQSLTASPEWQNAETLWDKIKLAWDKLIAEPFDSWWNGTGKAWLAEKASSIGEGLGSAIKTGILALLGVDVGGAVTDGVDIGKSFADGFMEGFDGSKVGEALAEAIKDGLKSLVLDAATLLPGGKEASSTSGLSAAVLGYGAFKTARTGYNLYKGGKALVDGTKAVGSAIGNVTGITEGINIFKAAQGGGSAAQSALAMAQNGVLGRGMKLGANMASGASKAGKFLSKAAVPLAAVGSAIEMGVDAYHGVGKAKEWTGSDSTGAKVASGIGAALGGTGDGILGQESAGKKALNIGGGALKGAGIGAAVGSILPGVGTAIGAAVGGGLGAAGAAIGGSNIAKALSSAGAAVGGFFTKTVPEKFGQFAEGAKGFFTETVPQALSSAGNAINGFFTETVPAKIGELVDGVGSFFTETVPYAIGYAAGKIQLFFTETVPQFFGNLLDGATNFFTQTVPAAIETAGAAIGDFFTVTVPTFFGSLWDGAVGFFTETVPTAIETVGTAVTDFFTVSVPEFFAGLVEGVTGFFTETVPQALETVGTALSTFFTETVPNFFSDLFDGVVNFFTEEVPNAIASVGESISGFFSNIGEKISGFFGGIWDRITGNAGAGYEAATAHADGGIMTRPHLGLVAEDGAEAIIPLSGNRRQRGLDLWERTGEMLGVKPYAEGGIIAGPRLGPAVEDSAEAIVQPSGDSRQHGLNLWERTGEMPGMKPYAEDSAETDISLSGNRRQSDPDPWVRAGEMLGVKPYAEDEDPDSNAPTPVRAVGNSGMSVPVNIQSLTFEIRVDGGNAQEPQELAAAIREHIRGMTDDIAYQLAAAMQQVYSNTPIEGWR